MTNQGHKDAINSLTNLKIKDAFEISTDQQIEKKIRLLGCMLKS